MRITRNFLLLFSRRSSASSVCSPVQPIDHSQVVLLIMHSTLSGWVGVVMGYEAPTESLPYHFGDALTLGPDCEVCF